MRSGAVVMAWNVFKFCTALRALGSLMILVVLGVVGASYYAVVVANYGPSLFAGGFSLLRSLAVLVPFHILLMYWHEHFILSGGFGLLMKSQPQYAHEILRELGLLLWAYFSVVLTDPGSVPSNWKPAVDEEIAETAPLTATEFSGNILNLQQPGPLTDTGSPKIRYCRKCNQLKPPRCHHCSVCGRCVLKMDHHCVWVVNCVGALNYKFFLLFLFYTFLETSLVTLSLFPHFIAFFKDVEMPGTPGTLATTFLAFVLNLAFALSVMGFLIMHLSLVMKNTTTIEAYEKKTTPNWEYDLGQKKNFEQVFGTDKKYWFVPAYSEEDLRRMPALQGFEYPTKSDLDTH